jgi:predicted TIM-barrel fold metal-dependent hydrolase
MTKPKQLMSSLAIICTTAYCLSGGIASAEGRPIVDAHIHYSHDAWEMLPPPKAVAILRKAGLKRAFVSSSSDDGTQKLYKLAPDLIVPVLRPYRKRGETGTWMHDKSVVAMLEDRLTRNKYAGIGEFHIFGKDAELPVFQEVIRLAKRHQIFLHAHSDSDAVDRIFKQYPDARVLWAHSGFDTPDIVREMLSKHKNLWADLAFRTEHAAGGAVDEDWEKLFRDFPDRFMVGTDTYTPERWYYVIEQADWSRDWLKDLPKDLADAIAYKNAQRLADWALKK